MDGDGGSYVSGSIGGAGVGAGAGFNVDSGASGGGGSAGAAGAAGATAATGAAGKDGAPGAGPELPLPRRMIYLAAVRHDCARMYQHVVQTKDVLLTYANLSSGLRYQPTYFCKF